MPLLPIGLAAGLGGAFRGARVSTGSVAGGASVNVVVPFAAPFADTNYAVSAAVEEGTAGDSLRVRKVLSRAAGSVTVLVANSDTLNARTGTVHVLAIHD